MGKKVSWALVRHPPPTRPTGWLPKLKKYSDLLAENNKEHASPCSASGSLNQNMIDLTQDKIMNDSEQQSAANSSPSGCDSSWALSQSISQCSQSRRGREPMSQDAYRKMKKLVRFEKGFFSKENCSGWMFDDSGFL